MQIQKVQPVMINQSNRLAQPAFRGTQDADFESGPTKMSDEEKEKITKALTSEKMPKFLKYTLIVGSAALVGFFGAKVATNRGFDFIDKNTRIFDGLAEKTEKGIEALSKKFPKPEAADKGVNAILGRFFDKFATWSKKGASPETLEAYAEYLVRKGTHDSDAIRAMTENFKKKGPIKRLFGTIGGVIGSGLGALKGSQDKDKDDNPDGIALVKKATNFVLSGGNLEELDLNFS